MNRFLKICLLVLVILPIWLTIVAFAEPVTLQGWQERINSKLLDIKDRRIQITEIVGHTKQLEALNPDVKFEVETTNLRDQGVSELALKISDNKGGLKQLVRITAKLFIETQVCVANRGLSNGEAIQADDFRTEWRDASTFRGSPIHAKDLVGKLVRGSVLENDVIYEARIQRPQLVTRGDRVRIMVLANGISIAVAGVAQESGSKGQSIKVLNSDSRKELIAVVTDSKSVEVRL